MPVLASVDRIRVHWLTTIVVGDLAYGLVSAFGKAEGASQLLLREVAPIQLWAVLYVAAAGLIWFGWSVWGGVAGTLAWGSAAVASAVAISLNLAPSWTGPVVLGILTYCHILVSFEVASGLDKDRERRQRKP